MGPNVVCKYFSIPYVSDGSPRYLKDVGLAPEYTKREVVLAPAEPSLAEVRSRLLRVAVMAPLRAVNM